MFLELWLHGTSFMFSYYLAKFWPILLAAGSMTFVGYSSGFEEITNKLLFVFTIEAFVFAFVWCVLLQFTRLLSCNRNSLQDTQRLGRILLGVCISILNEISEEKESAQRDFSDSESDSDNDTSHEESSQECHSEPEPPIRNQKNTHPEVNECNCSDSNMSRGDPPQECHREPEPPIRNQKNTHPEVNEGNCSES